MEGSDPTTVFVSASKYTTQSITILPPSSTGNIRVKIWNEQTLPKTD